MHYTGYTGRRRKRTAVFAAVLLVLAVMAVIFLFSAQTGDESGGLSRRIVEWLVHLFLRDWQQRPAAELAALYETVGFWVRKVAHFLEFAALGCSFRLLFVALGRRPPAVWALVWSWLFSTLYAVTDEVHQMFVEGKIGRAHV